MNILDTVSEQCFKYYKEDELIDGKVPSGDGFAMLLSFEDLIRFCHFNAKYHGQMAKIYEKQMQ